MRCWRSRSRTRPPQEMRERVEALIGDDGRGRLALDVPLAVRAAAAARGAGDRAVARLRHLRLVRSGRGRQAGAARARHRRQARAAARRRSRASARPRTGWRGRSRCAAAGTCATSRSRRSTRAYLAALKDANALDFDDLLLKTVELFETSEHGPRVLRAQVQVRHGRRVPGHEPAAVPADPPAGRSAPQPRASSAIPISRSTSGAAPTCATSSTSSSDFPDAKIVRLEQNYRSTQVILDAASAVISQNRNRKDKRLWTDRKGGAKIVYFRGNDELEEADFITPLDQAGPRGGRRRDDGGPLPHQRAVARD